MHDEFKKLFSFVEFRIGTIVTFLIFFIFIVIDSLNIGVENYQEGINTLITFFERFGELFIPVFILVGLSSLMTYEKVQNTSSIIHAAKSGTTQCFKEKVLMSTIFSMVVVLIISLVAFIVYGIRFKFQGVLIPPNDAIVRSSLPAIVVYVVHMLFEVFCSLNFAVSILLLSSLFSKGSTVMATEGVIFVSLMLIHKWGSYLSEGIRNIVFMLYRYSSISMMNLWPFHLFSSEDNFLDFTTIFILILSIISKISLTYFFWRRGRHC